MFFKIRKSNPIRPEGLPMDGPDMVRSYDPPGAVSRWAYYEAGGELGGYRRVAVNRLSSNVAEIRIERQESHDSEEEKSVRRVSTDVFREIQKLVNEYDMFNWDQLPASDIMEMDGPSRSIEIVLDGETRRAKDYYAWPDAKPVWDIIKHLETYK